MQEGTKGKRYALPKLGDDDTSATWWNSGAGNRDRDGRTRHILKTKEKLNKMLSENPGKPLDVIAADTDRDNWMTAEEACAYGLIDSVITSKIKDHQIEISDM